MFSRKKNRRLGYTIAALVIATAALFGNWQGDRLAPLPPDAPPAGRENPPPPPGTDSTRTGPIALGPHLVGNVAVIDINTGKRIELGTVDLKPTLDRIAAGGRDEHRNDGAVFQNRSRALPSRPRGYYREYVVPTPGVRGVGPQRLVIGREGEVYYTHDHYDSFIRLPGGD